jgi:hypothetical protein
MLTWKELRTEPYWRGFLVAGLGVIAALAATVVMSAV